MNYFDLLPTELVEHIHGFNIRDAYKNVLDDINILGEVIQRDEDLWNSTFTEEFLEEYVPSRQECYNVIINFVADRIFNIYGKYDIPLKILRILFKIYIEDWCHDKKLSYVIGLDSGGSIVEHLPIAMVKEFDDIMN